MSKRKCGPTIGPNGHRKPLNTRPYVDGAVFRILEIWGDMYKLPAGRIIDAAIMYASKKPDFKLPLKGARNKPNNNKEIQDNG